jgi:hypothetical protein
MMPVAKTRNLKIVPLLQYRANADSNLSKWIEAIQPFLESLFGHLASFIATEKYHKPKAPKPVDKRN